MAEMVVPFVPLCSIRKTEVAIAIVMLSSYAKETAANEESPPTVTYVLLPVMLWLDVKLMESDFALGNAKPESDSPPEPVATNEVALTTPLTVRSVRQFLCYAEA